MNNPEDIVITDYEVEVLNNLAQKIYQYNVYKGWWDTNFPEDLKDKFPEFVSEYEKMIFASNIALIGSELSEALEGDRKNKMDDHIPYRKNSEVEIADAFIRQFDLAGRELWDIGGAIQEKFAYNKIRADHKKENRALENGKKY